MAVNNAQNSALDKVKRECLVSSNIEDLKMGVRTIEKISLVPCSSMQQSAVSDSANVVTKMSHQGPINSDIGRKDVSENNLTTLLTTAPHIPDKRSLAARGPKKALTLGERMTVIKLNDEGKSTRQIARILGVGRTQIQLTLKRKDEYIHNYNQNAPLEQRRQMRKTGNESVNELCWQWYQEMFRRNIKINGPMLKERALSFAAENGNKTFKASNGWLDSFLKRHNIAFGKVSSESSNTDPTIVADWKKKVKLLCDGYEEKDIFTLDETGLFFKITAEKSFYSKGQQCLTGKKAKDRLTIMLCTSMLGEKETAVVIGSLSLSKYLSDINISLLPVNFKLSYQSWMNSDLFIPWLTSFNNKMALQQRHIILFLDNAACHQYLQLSNIKLQYLPPNISRLLQPLHHGVVQDLKQSFRRKQISYLAGEMEAHPCVSAIEFMKKTDVIDTLYWVASSWNDISEQDIRQCFIQCGFAKLPDTTKNMDQFTIRSLVTPPEFNRICSELIGGNFSDMCVVDEDLAVCNMNADQWDNSVNHYPCIYASEHDQDSEEDFMVNVVSRRPSFAQANDAVKTLCKYAQSQGLSQIVDQIFTVQESLVLAKCNQRQKTIDDFLKPYI